jgi:hypothetical protein
MLCCYRLMCRAFAAPRAIVADAYAMRARGGKREGAGGAGVFTAWRVSVLMVACAAVIGLAQPAAGQFTCATATPVGLSVPIAGNNVASPGDGIGGQCVSTSRAVWHSFVASISGTYTISLCGSSFDSVITLYGEQCGTQVLACDDDTCGTNALVVFPLVAGQGYKVRVSSKNSSPGGAYELRITEPSTSPATNDSCGLAQVLVPNSTTRTGNLGAGGTDITPSCGTSDTSDVWYSLIPSTSGVHRVEVCATGFKPVVSVHSGCLGGAVQACDAAGAVPGCDAGTSAAVNFSATPGSPALIRVAGLRGSAGSFTIAAYTARPNDLCANAQALAVDVSTAGQTTPILASESVVSCATSSADVWYRITPANSGLYGVTLCGANFDSVLSVHSSCPSQPGSSVLACNDDVCGTASALVTPMTAGTTYWIRVAGKTAPGGLVAWGSFNVLVQQQSPTNDQCTTPAVLQLGVPINGDNIGATGTDLTFCGSGDSKDVWYSFTAPSAGQYEFNTCGSELATVLSVLTACGGAVVGCSDGDAVFCGPGTGARVTLSLSAGVTYRVRVAGLGGAEGTFTLAVARTSPSNDSCASAAAITVLTPIAATVTGAGSSGVTACGAGDGPDIWFAFVAPVSRYFRIDTCGSTLDGVVSVYPGCSLSVQLACAVNSIGACPGAASGASAVAYFDAGVSYRIRVAAVAGSTSGGSVRLLVSPIAPPNDTCDGAAPLVLTETIYGATSGAVPGAGAAPCATGDELDVWYTFTPPATGTYQINTCAASTLDTVITLHESCGGAAVACNDDAPAICGIGSGGSAVTMRLSGGTPYFVRVAGVGGASGAFYITASLAAPANDTCDQAQSIGNEAVVFDTLAATTDPVFIDGSCTLGFNLISNDVWFRYSATRTTGVTFSTCGATFDTVIAIVDPSSSPGGACPIGTMSVLTCNDDFACFVGVPNVTPQSQVTANVTAGQAYLVRVGSRLGATGNGLLRVTPLACPCDINSDDALSLDDLFAYLARFFDGTGDFNGDGSVSTQDIFDFIACWFSRPAGC